MSRTVISKYVTPWKYRREQRERRIAVLRQRDGDDCRRCRRPIRFDLTDGHNLGPAIEPMFDDNCLCHRRCNAESADNTTEVLERVRRRSEAELFARARSQPRPKRRAAG